MIQPLWRVPRADQQIVRIEQGGAVRASIWRGDRAEAARQVGGKSQATSSLSSGVLLSKLQLAILEKAWTKRWTGVRFGVRAEIAVKPAPTSRSGPEKLQTWMWLVLLKPQMESSTP